MHLQSVGVGRSTVDARAIYGAETRFGRAAHINRRYFIAGVVVIMAVGLVIRLWNLDGASLWTDEALTAYRAEAPFQESLASIMAAGNQTPLYFWFLRLFPNSTDTLLRLPSAMLGLAGIGLMMATVMRLYQDREITLWAGAMLAVNPFHIWLSRTARPYSMLFVLSLLICYFFLMLLRGNRSRAIWIGFTLSSMLAYSTHFTAIALPAAQYLLFAFMLRQQYKLLRRWMAAQVIAVIPALGWAYVVLSQPLSVASEWIPRPELRDLPLTLWNMTLGYDGLFEWHMVPGLMIVTMGLIFGFNYAAEERMKNRREYFWMWMIIITIIPVFLMSRFFVSIYVDRYFTLILPAVLLLIMQGWLSFSWHSRLLFRLAMLTIVITGLYTVLFAFYAGSYRRDDWRSVAEYVAERYEPGDTILLERDNTTKVFARYYAQMPDAHPDPRLAQLWNLPDTSDLERTSARVWVIYRNPNEDVHRMGQMPDFDPFNPHLSKMGEWLSVREDQLVERRTFHGVVILLIDPQAASVAAQP
ncbi:MAG: glycosyltransferase family 39 protein [Chloroflexi bacterium]|nr:glycosyltransferase family 39 protein [Chloroflexota bacterium]